MKAPLALAESLSQRSGRSVVVGDGIAMSTLLRVPLLSVAMWSLDVMSGAGGPPGSSGFPEWTGLVELLGDLESPTGCTSKPRESPAMT